MTLSRTPGDWSGRRIRRSYARFMLLAVRRGAVDVDHVLAGTGVTAAEIESAGSQTIPFEAIYRLAKALPSGVASGIGLELGDLSPTTVHGPLGVAVSGSATLGEALFTIAQMGAGPTRILRFDFEVGGAFGDLKVTPDFDLRDIYHFIVECNVAFIARMLTTTIGQPVEGLEFHFPYPAPPWSDRYVQHLRARIVFEADALRVRVPRSQLALKSVAADPRAREAGLREWRREADEAEAIVRADLTLLIRGRLALVGDTYPALESISRSLGMSTRTLIRRLRDKGLRYRQLVDEARAEVACWRLAHTDDTIEQIAADLGYVDTSNFSRTFRRWRGTAPSVYRAAVAGRRPTAQTV
jgi:AraC-like DNA-binding protein